MWVCGEVVAVVLLVVVVVDFWSLVFLRVLFVLCGGFSVVGGSCLAQSIVMGSVLLVACHHHSSMRRSAHCSARMMSLVRAHET